MIAALITALCLLAAGATVWIRGWLARRDAQAGAEVAVDAARKTEAVEAAKADATLVEERKKDPIDVVNERFGGKP